MKKKFFTCILITIVLATVGAVTALASDIRVQLDGVYVDLDPAPIIVEGRTLLPARAVVEMLGGDIDWDGDLRQVHIDKDDIHILLTIDDPIAYLNGEAVELDVPPQIIEDRTMVPLRFVAESFGLEIDFQYGTVIITTNVNFMVTPINFTLLNGDVLTVLYTPVVRRNAQANVSLVNQPYATWHLSIRYAAGYGTAAGLGEATADGTGFAEWTWRIGSNTTLGNWPVTITGSGESMRFYINIIES